VKIVAQLQHDQLTPSGLMVVTTTRPTRIGKTTVAACVRSIFEQVRHCVRSGFETGRGVLFMSCSVDFDAVVTSGVGAHPR
jgi:hypothetical protein